MSVNDLVSLHDFAAYWADCLPDLDTKSDQAVAGWMMNVISNSHFQQLYDEGHGQPDVVKIFELVASLELPNGVTEIANDKMRGDYWRHVHQLVKSLVDRTDAHLP